MLKLQALIIEIIYSSSSYKFTLGIDVCSILSRFRFRTCEIIENAYIRYEYNSSFISKSIYFQFPGLKYICEIPFTFNY